MIFFPGFSVGWTREPSKTSRTKKRNGKYIFIIRPEFNGTNSPLSSFCLQFWRIMEWRASPSFVSRMKSIAFVSCYLVSVSGRDVSQTFFEKLFSKFNSIRSVALVRCIVVASLEGKLSRRIILHVRCRWSCPCERKVSSFHISISCTAACTRFANNLAEAK